MQANNHFTTKKEMNLFPSDMFFETVQRQYTNQLPFVVYRMPNSEEIKALLQTNNQVYYVEDYKEAGFVFAPFDNSKKSVLIPFEQSDNMRNSYTRTGLPFNDHAVFANAHNKQNHINLIEKGIQAIANQTFKKVVLSRNELVPLSKFSVVETFKKLLASYPMAFVYCWYHPKIGLWLGATPETLMKIEGHHFSMMSLAGTQEYNGNIDVDWEDKEKEEQQIVTDFIVNSLKPFVKDINTSKVETVKAGNLLHLKTIITAKLNQERLNLKNLINALHPTPAVCGFPKDTAKAFILENEGYHREFYTGYLGELNLESTRSPRASQHNIENRAYAITKKTTQLYVNLRCMQIKEHNALIYIGGGITKTSNAEKEWEETVSKSKVIKSIL